jgi:hypothetical protein
MNVQGFPYPQTIKPYSWDPSQPLRVRVVTWNMGDSKYELNDWKQDLQTNWTFITQKDFDVLAVCLQEDARGKLGKLGDAIGALLQAEFTMVSNSVEGPPEISRQHFSVRAYLYLRKSIFVNCSTKKNDVCLKRAVFCTKGTAGISVLCPLPGKFFQLILLSSHLPLNMGVEDLGYEERIAAVKKSMETVYDALVDNSVQQRLAFWAGDLNFRDNTPVKPGGKPFDQLEYALSVRPSFFWREFVEPDVAFPPTCKLAVCKDSQCPVCRRRSDQDFTPSCYDKDGQAAKGKVKEREPSHCDRIFYRPDGVEGEILEYRSWSDSTAVGHSDHNLVLASFNIFL